MFDCEKVIENITAGIRKHIDIAVVGLSGGADSTLTAILCMKALGAENVCGISMPYNNLDRRTFNSDSEQLALKIGIQHLVRPIDAIADAITEQIAVSTDAEPGSVNIGNSRSRARMCVLYGIAHDLSSTEKNKRVRVIGTGNMSEDFIGYDTKGGDALADLFPIGELFKSEVYRLLNYFRDNSLIDDDNINRVPSAGLEDEQTDEIDLGYTYDEMEPAIRFCLANYDSIRIEQLDEVTSFVWRRHLANKHKHEAAVVVRG